MPTLVVLDLVVLYFGVTDIYVAVCSTSLFMIISLTANISCVGLILLLVNGISILVKDAGDIAPPLLWLLSAKKKEKEK